MSFDNNPDAAELIYEPTAADRVRWVYGRYLVWSERISEVFDDHGVAMKLPAPIVSRPTFPMAALPDRVDGA